MCLRDLSFRMRCGHHLHNVVWFGDLQKTQNDVSIWLMLRKRVYGPWSSDRGTEQRWPTPKWSLLSGGCSICQYTIFNYGVRWQSRLGRCGSIRFDWILCIGFDKIYAHWQTTELFLMASLMTTTNGNSTWPDEPPSARHKCFEFKEIFRSSGRPFIGDGRFGLSRRRKRAVLANQICKSEDTFQFENHSF